ncbi:MAG: N,N-dimethylformamidase beta subunit family domain-containing protein [Pseudomonadota bacterium]
MTLTPPASPPPPISPAPTPELLAYADKMSVRPGETIAFKLSATTQAPITPRLVRIVCADPNPAGPGLIEHAVKADLPEAIAPRHQPFYPGSYAQVPLPADAQALESFTALATLWPTRIGHGPQTIMSWLDEAAGTGAALALDEHGHLALQIATANGIATVTTEQALSERRWVHVAGSYDATSGLISVLVMPLKTRRWQNRTGDRDAAFSASAPTSDAHPEPSRGELLIATATTAPQHACFNGKIEAPRLLAAVPDPDALMWIMAATEDDLSAVNDVVMWMDFARATPTTIVEDIGPHGLVGQLINHPARGMTGSLWNGHHQSWSACPAHYNAIHFHDDDIVDFGWDTDLAFAVPPDLPSGIYAMRFASAGHEDAVPFFVPAAKDANAAPIAVLMSTFTYAIYGNHARPDFEPAWEERFQAWNAYPHNPARHPTFGLSTYNNHSDGSGICHASHLRPLFNVRPGYVTFGYGEGSGLRHFPADTHLIAWLEAKGFAYDIVTDELLHNEGVDALARYKTVLTGSHPEYHTHQTLDALRHYRDGGGHLCYLGGNGFYWRIATHSENPGILEIRRGEGGIRAWASEPGEYYNAFDGDYGGLWRRIGRPPQDLVGVGFSAQGNFSGSHYIKRDPPPPSASWIFEGIEGERFGGYGLSGGGAAGFELDRADERLGTPAHAHVLASSADHDDTFILVPEERLTHLVTLPGEPEADLIRADMIYYDVPGGGAVFAVGSITFCGSLPINDFDNDISRLLENVVRRFLQ